MNNSLKTLLAAIPLCALTLGAEGLVSFPVNQTQSPEATPVAKGQMAPAPHESMTSARSAALRRSSAKAASGLRAEFTAGSADARAAVHTSNFDTGFDDWTPDPTSNVKWSTKQIGAPGTPKSYSTIDPADKMSLFVEGPYSTIRREISSATSPVITVPANGAVSFHAGFSRNYDDQCRLILSISTDNFATSTELWNSKNETGEKPWCWRPVVADLTPWAGIPVRFRLTYSWGAKDNFQTGGYMGDFAIDGFTVSGLQPVESVTLKTGDRLRLTDLSSGNPVEWLWEMPGATPATSTEANPEIYYTLPGVYPVTLTVRNAEGESATVTREAFATVEGTAPMAVMGLPATFRNASNRRHLIAPLAPVQFTDLSTGFPTERLWAISGVDADPAVTFTSTEANPTVGFSFLHNQAATLAVANELGTSMVTAPLSVEYEGVITNLRPEDRPTTFSMDDWGVFPGSNTRKITAYAERFSKPSRPVVITGAYVYFNRAEATEVIDQIAPIGVSLYTSENGKPGKMIDCMWWSTFELDMPQDGELVGTAFPFTDAPVVNDEFFIVVDGLPEYKEGCCVSFSMAALRADGNTALMQKDGEWMEVSDYFPAGANCTSYLIYPAIQHSVLCSLPAGNDKILLPATAGEVTHKIFSYMGYDAAVVSDSEWMHVTSTPNGMTVDDLTIAFDALPEGTTSRTGTLTVTDGASTLTLTAEQSTDNPGSTGISAVTTSLDGKLSADTSTPGIITVNAPAPFTLYTLGGSVAATGPAGTTTLSTPSLAPGAYLLRTATSALKLTVK